MADAEAKERYRLCMAEALPRAKADLRVESVMDEVAAVAVMAGMSLADFLDAAKRSYYHKENRLKTLQQNYAFEINQRRPR